MMIRIDYVYNGGSRAAISNDAIHTVTYAVAYNKTPTVFTQQIGTSANINYAPVVTSNGASSFQVLPSGGGNGGNENGFNWISIGLV